MSPYKVRLSLTLAFALSAVFGRADTTTANFNDNTLGPLGAFIVGDGQGGGSGWLEGNVWATTGTIVVIDGDLTAPPATGYSIVQGAIPQSAQGTFNGGKHTTREIAIPLSGTVWFSYLLNQPTTNSRGGITINNIGAAPGNPRIVATGADLRLGLTAIQAPGAGANGVFTPGETALVLGRLMINPAGDEILDVWVNPDVSGGELGLPAPTNSMTEQSAALDAGITTLGIQSYSSDMMGGIVDAFRISDALDAFQQVTSNGDVFADDPNIAVSLTNPFGGVVATVETGAVTADLTITNTGTDNTLTIADTTGISGRDAADFSILTALPLEIPPGQSTTLQLQFTPPAEHGDSTASLELDSNDTSSPMFSIPLGATFSPLLQVDMSDPFGDIVFELDPAPVTREITLTNTAAFTTITVTGTSFNDFLDPNFTVLNATPFDILPGETVALQVTFDAMGDGGELTGMVQIDTTDPGNPNDFVVMSAKVPQVGVDILKNGDFEHDGDELSEWLQPANSGPIIPGFAPGDSQVAAEILGTGFIQQDFLGLADWYADFFFQAPDTANRAFNVLIYAPGSQINMRYQGTSAGALNTWNAYDNVTAQDNWGDDLGLGAITPDATYFMRIVGHGWGGASPTYDLLLSEAGSTSLTRSVEGLTRYQNKVVDGPPTGIRFSAEFGTAPGFIVDDVRVANGPPPPAVELEIIDVTFADGDATITWTAEPGRTYFVWGSDDLENWEELDDSAATGVQASYTERGLTGNERFYYVIEGE